MSDQRKECATCALLRKLKDDGEYYNKQRPDRRDKHTTICKSAIIMEDYYEGNDGNLAYGGRVAYNPTTMNFCFECGRKIGSDDVTW